MENEIDIPCGDVVIKGNLHISEESTGLVLFAHGSGSGRFSPRNNYVAKYFQDNGLSTLLMDLLTKDEELDRNNVFDIDLLAKRLVETTKWALKSDMTKELKIGYFGSSTGAAAALQAASVLSVKVSAVVSRGGRPDLAVEYLGNVKTPTLFLVGGDDIQVIPLNEMAFEALNSEKKFTIIEGAGHLFEEPGKLDEVAKHASEWFVKCLG